MGKDMVVSYTSPANGAENIGLRISLKITYSGDLLPWEFYVNGELALACPEGNEWSSSALPWKLGMPGDEWLPDTEYSWYVRYADHADSATWVVDHWVYTGLHYTTLSTRTFTAKDLTFGTTQTPTNGSTINAVPTSLKTSVVGLSTWPSNLDRTSSYYVVNDVPYAVDPLLVDYYTAGSTYSVGKTTNSNVLLWPAVLRNYTGVNGLYSWYVVMVYNGVQFVSPTYTFTLTLPPQRATTPSPEDTEEDISLSLAELSWEDGGTGDYAATSYDVWFATSYGEDPFVLVAEGITNTYVSFDDIVLELEPETEYSWWVVSYNEGGEIEGYVWTFTTAAGSLPVKATTPSPAHEATNVLFSQATLSWVDPGTGEQIATSFDVYINEIKTSTVTEPVAAIVSFLLPTSYTWRVDSINADGTTTGDTWTFTVDDSPIINVQNNGVWHPNGTYTAIIYAPDSNVGVTLCYDDAESNLNKVLGTGISVESKLSSLWSRYAIEVPGNVGTGTLYIKWHYDA